MLDNFPVLQRVMSVSSNLQQLVLSLPVTFQ